MKNTLYILSSVLLLAFTYCKQNDPIQKTSNYFSNITPDNKPVAEIDLSKPDSTLIKDIEKQLNINLCDESKFTGKITFENIEIKFPAYVRKNCNWNTHYLNNVVLISINKNNRVFVSEKLVENDNSIEKKVIETTKKLTESRKRELIVYMITWTNDVNSELVKRRLFETLQAIKNYTNELAIKNYNKDISALSKTELSNLKNEFYGIIGFNDYFAPPPPLPETKTKLEQ